MPNHPPLPAGSMFEVEEYSGSKLRIVILKKAKQQILARKANLEIVFFCLLIVAGFVVYFLPIKPDDKFIWGLLGFFVLLRSLWMIFVYYPMNYVVSKSPYLRDSLIVIEPDCLILKDTVRFDDAGKRHHIDSSYKSVRFEQCYQESPSDEYVSLTNGDQRINFGKELSRADKDWLIQRINELLGRQLRDQCPECGEHLFNSQIDLVAKNMTCTFCGWSAEINESPPKQAKYRSTAHKQQPLVFAPSEDGVNESTAILTPPPAVQVLRASANMLRLKVRPHRGLAIGCGMFLSFFIVPGIIVAFYLKFPDNIIAGLTMSGFGVLGYLLLHRPVFGTTYISFDRQSRTFIFREVYRTKTRKLNSKACIKLFPDDRLIESHQIVEIERNTGDQQCQLYLAEQNPLHFLELVPNQSERTKRWLKQILNQYIQEDNQTLAKMTKATINKPEYESETSEEKQLAIIKQMDNKQSAGEQRHHDPTAEKTNQANSLQLDFCPQCGEELTPSMVNIKTLTVNCPRLLSCGWVSDTSSHIDQYKLIKADWIRYSLRKVEDYFILKK